MRARRHVIRGCWALALCLTVGMLGGATPVHADRSPLPAPEPAPGDELRITAVDAAGFPNVTATVALPVRVRDQPDSSLQLSVSSAGAQIPADVVHLPGAQQSVVLLLDAAIDVDGETLAAEQGAAVELLRQLDPSTTIYVGTSGAQRLVATDATSAIATVGALVPGGPRDWSRAVGAALDAVATAERSTIVVVSAGPQSIITSPAASDVDERLVASAAAVRWIGLSADAGPTGDLGGLGATVASPASLLVRLDSIAAMLADQYAVSFRVDPRATAAAITLTVDGQTWIAETPLPLPSSPILPAAGLPQVASEAPVPGAQSPTAASTSKSGVLDRTSSRIDDVRDFAADNVAFLFAAAAALLVLGASTLAIRTSSGEGRRQRSS